MKPAMKTRRRPSRSAIRPPSSRKPPNASTYAFTSQASPSCERSQIPPDRRQRDVDHRRVEHDDELRGGEQRERPPLALLGLCLIEHVRSIFELREAPYIGSKEPRFRLWALVFGGSALGAGGEAVAPARVARRPAQLGLRLGVGGAAGLGHHHHRGGARDDLGEPRRDVARRLGAERARRGTAATRWTGAGSSSTML